VLVVGVLNTPRAWAHKLSYLFWLFTFAFTYDVHIVAKQPLNSVVNFIEIECKLGCPAYNTDKFVKDTNRKLSYDYGYL
jgi:hypothetical protein